MKQTLEESMLISNLINNSEDAFCDIYALYKDRLFYFVLRYIKSKECAEDICHDVFFALWQNRFYINSDTCLSSYLYTIARNRIFHHLRNSKSDERLRNHILANAIDFENDTMNAVSVNELNSVISQAISNLTDRQREIFGMSRDKGMTHKEIAVHLNISLPTVQEHISLALKGIRNAIKRYNGNYSSILILLFYLNS